MQRAMLSWLAAGWVVSLVFLNPHSLAADSPAVAPAATTPQPAAVAVDENYRIVKEDVLRLDVWGEPTLSSMQMQVTPDGKINTPFIGPMQAEGLTQGELTKNIVKALADRGILYDAMVQITLVTMHQPTCRVLGEVNRAGTITYKEGDTVLDAVASAGSYTENAMLEKATLTRKDSDTPIPIDLRKMFRDGDLSQNYRLQNGDAVYIPPEDYKNKAYVLGQVYKPGIIALKDKTTLLTAISIAGGQTEKGSLKKTVVVRGNPENPKPVRCDLNRLFSKGDLSQDIVLQPGDVVIVPEKKGITWDKVSQFLGTLVNIGYITRLGLF